MKALRKRCAAIFAFGLRSADSKAATVPSKPLTGSKNCALKINALGPHDLNFKAKEPNKNQGLHSRGQVGHNQRLNSQY